MEEQWKKWGSIEKLDKETEPEGIKCSSKVDKLGVSNGRTLDQMEKQPKFVF